MLHGFKRVCRSMMKAVACDPVPKMHNVLVLVHCKDDVVNVQNESLKPFGIAFVFCRVTRLRC